MHINYCHVVKGNAFLIEPVVLSTTLMKKDN